MKIRAPDEDSFAKILGFLMSRGVGIDVVNVGRLYLGGVGDLPGDVADRVRQLGGELLEDHQYEPDLSDAPIPAGLRFEKGWAAGATTDVVPGPSPQVDPGHVFPMDSLISAKFTKNGDHGEVTVTGKPVEIHEDDVFEVSVEIPPLKRPEIEGLVEGLQLRNPKTGGIEEKFVACLADRMIRVGDVGIELADLKAEGTTRQEAIQGLAELASQAVAQVYFDLLTRGDEEGLEAAKSMEE